MAPSVSVIIPTFNYGRFLPEAIESVLAQTYTDYEIIVVDGGSTDNTPEVIKCYQDRLRYIFERSPVPNHSRNLGILASHGRFVAFLDADDKWLPQKLERQVPMMESLPRVGLVYSQIFLFDSDTGMIVGRSDLRSSHRGKVLRDLYLTQFVPSPTPLIRREVFDQVGLFDEGTLGADDWEMWMRIAAYFEFEYSPEYLALYRQHPSMAGRRPIELYEDDMVRFIQQMADRFPALRPLRARRLSTFAETLAWHLIRAGEVGLARGQLIRAIHHRAMRLNPYLMLAYVWIFGRCIKKANWQFAQGAYIQGKYYLANGRLNDARSNFAKSIKASRSTWWRPYAGWLLTFGGRRLARIVRQRVGLGFYTGMQETSLQRLPNQQW